MYVLEVGGLPTVSAEHAHIGCARFIFTRAVNTNLHQGAVNTNLHEMH
jgi:hypothetical protein